MKSEFSLIKRLQNIPYNHRDYSRQPGDNMGSFNLKTFLTGLLLLGAMTNTFAQENDVIVDDDAPVIEESEGADEAPVVDEFLILLIPITLKKNIKTAGQDPAF